MGSIGYIYIIGGSRSLLYSEQSKKRIEQLNDEYVRRCDENIAMNRKKILGAHRSLCRNLFRSGKCSLKGGRCDSDCDYMKEFINDLSIKP